MLRIYQIATIALGAIMLLFLILALAGVIEVHLPAKESPETDQAEEPRSTSEDKKAWITQRDTAAYFDLASLEGAVFDYQGSLIECWFEVEMNGEITKLEEGFGTQLQSEVNTAFPEASSDEMRGHFVMLFRPEDRGFSADLTLQGGPASAANAIKGTIRNLSLPAMPEPEAGLTRYWDEFTLPTSPLKAGEVLVLHEIHIFDAPAEGDADPKLQQIIRLMCRPLS